MIWFDLILVGFVSVELAIKSVYLGCITLIIGFLIGYQSKRTERLLGSHERGPSVSRRVKAGLLAVLVTAALFPLVTQAPIATENTEKLVLDETLLPVVIVVGFFAAVMMAALAIEKRKR